MGSNLAKAGSIDDETSSLSARGRVAIAGGFPPPVTGMTLATDRLYRMLYHEYTLTRVNFAENERGDPGNKISLRRSRAVHRYAKDVRKASPDVMIYANLSGSIPGHLRDMYTFRFGISSGNRVICWIHNGNIVRHHISILRRRSAATISRKISKYVFVSPLLMREMAPFVKSEKQIVIPYTIDEELLCSESDIISRKTRDRPSMLRILYISNMIRSKGYEDLLEAAALLKARGVIVHVDFVGRWFAKEHESRFQKKIDAAGMEGQVSVHGPIHDRNKVKAMLLTADVFILPSYYPNEASPLCLIEALNAGLPVVSTRHAGIPDTIRDGYNGLLAETQNPEDLAQKIIPFLDDDYRHGIAKNARASFEQTFAPEVVKAKWINLLEVELSGIRAGV